MKIKTLNKAVAGVLLTSVVALASTAQAAVITSSYTNAPETTEINQAGMLDQFDGSLGTLNSVTLTFEGTSVSTTTLTNNAAQAAQFSFDSILNFFFNAGSVGQSLASPLFVTTLASTNGFVDLASGASLNLGPNTDMKTVVVNVAAADFGNFMGLGQFETSCTTISGATFSGGGGNIANLQTTEAFCEANIAYDYTAVIPPQPVSAPASVLLLGAGLLGLAGVRRAKK